MTDTMESQQPIKRWLVRGTLNMAWLAVTLVFLAVVHTFWMYQSWAWGLLLGAGAGGGAVFIVAFLARESDFVNEEVSA